MYLGGGKMCWHKYGKWSKPFDSETTRPTGNFGDWRNVAIVQQSRTCQKCNRIDTRYIRDGYTEDTKGKQ